MTTPASLLAINRAGWDRVAPIFHGGTYARPSNTIVVRAEGGKLIVQDRPNGGGTPREYPVAFYGPDRVVGRVAVRTP